MIDLRALLTGGSPTRVKPKTSGKATGGKTSAGAKSGGLFGPGAFRGSILPTVDPESYLDQEFRRIGIDPNKPLFTGNFLGSPFRVPSGYGVRETVLAPFEYLKWAKSEMARDADQLQALHASLKARAKGVNIDDPAAYRRFMASNPGVKSWYESQYNQILRSSIGRMVSQGIPYYNAVQDASKFTDPAWLTKTIWSKHPATALVGQGKKALGELGADILDNPAAAVTTFIDPEALGVEGIGLSGERGFPSEGIGRGGIDPAVGGSGLSPMSGSRYVIERIPKAPKGKPFGIWDSEAYGGLGDWVRDKHGFATPYATTTEATANIPGRAAADSASVVANTGAKAAYGGTKPTAGAKPGVSKRGASAGQPSNPVLHVSSYPGTTKGRSLDSLLFRHADVLGNLDHDDYFGQLPILQQLGIPHNVINPRAIASTQSWAVDPYLQIELPGASPEIARAVGALFGDAWLQDGVGIYGVGEPHYVAKITKKNGSKYSPNEINSIAGITGRYNIGVDTNAENTAIEFHRYPFEGDDWGSRFFKVYNALQEMGLIGSHDLTDGIDRSDYLPRDRYGQLREDFEGIGETAGLQDTPDVAGGGSRYEYARGILGEAAKQAHESIYGPGSWPDSPGSTGAGGQGVGPPPPKPPGTGPASGNAPGANSLPPPGPTKQSSVPLGFVPAMTNLTPGLENLYGMSPAHAQSLIAQFYGRNVG